MSHLRCIQLGFLLFFVVALGAGGVSYFAFADLDSAWPILSGQPISVRAIGARRVDNHWLQADFEVRNLGLSTAQVQGAVESCGFHLGSGVPSSLAPLRAKTFVGALNSETDVVEAHIQIFVNGALHTARLEIPDHLLPASPSGSSASGTVSILEDG